MNVRCYLICAFTGVVGFINKYIDLVVVQFIVNTKYSTLPSSFKIHWAWLKGVTGEMDLLGIVKRNVDLPLKQTEVVASWLSVFMDLFYYFSTRILII